jgi:three-Cys-motif partner protein
VILEALKEAKARVLHEQQRRKPIKFDVKLVCIDADPSAVEHLGQVLEDEGYGEQLRSGAIETLLGEFAGKAEAVIAEARRRSPKAGRAIFVLDQYGYDKVPLPVMKQIFGALKHAEVILTFNVDSLINFLNDKNVRDFERKTGVMGAITAADMDKAQRGPAWRLRVQAGLYQKITQGSGAAYFTPFFVRPERGHGDFWLLHLSQHWKARDVMAGAHWKHHNHFVHYGRAGFDMLSTGYAARIDDDAKPQVAFEFDDVASTASQDEMLVQIPQALAQYRAGIAFKQFFVERVNTTPATEVMVEQAVLQLVRDRQVQVIGPDGTVRNVRTALKPDHVIKLPDQQVFSFL